MRLVKNITGNERVTFELRPSRLGGLSNYTVSVSGTFGSGTVAFQMSPDGGTTWIALSDASGAVTLTTDDVKQIQLESDSKTPAQLGFNMTGATSPDVDVIVYNAE